jgi:hypothetical protein
MQRSVQRSVTAVPLVRWSWSGFRVESENAPLAGRKLARCRLNRAARVMVGVSVPFPSPPTAFLFIEQGGKVERRPIILTSRRRHREANRAAADLAGALLSLRG